MKPWIKFQNKLKLHETLPIEEWNSYQFLGYFLAKTGQTIEPEELHESITEEVKQSWNIRKATPPKDHPMKEAIRGSMRLAAKDYGMTNAGYLVFLDWCIHKYGTRTSTSSLTHMLGKYQEHLITNKRVQKTDRTTPLPQSVIDMFPSLNTYGDLALWIQIYPSDMAKLQNTSITIEQLKKVV
jgi:hypothetical protein